MDNVCSGDLVRLSSSSGLSLSTLAHLSDVYRQNKAAASKRKKKKQKQKQRFHNWFESCTAAQLKELCRATTTLTVSGTKVQLVERLMSSSDVKELSEHSVAGLKQLCSECGQVQSGNKYDLVLRLVRAHNGVADAGKHPAVANAAAGAAKGVEEESTIQEQPPKKRRKAIPSPQTMYTRISKKMNAVNQPKYQSHYGSKSHSMDVYSMMKDFIWDHGIGDTTLETNPKLALEMATSVFRAFLDHWDVMVRVGYGTEDFREAVDGFALILDKVRPMLTPEEVKDIVNLLTDVDSHVVEYGLSQRYMADPAVYYSTGSGKDSPYGSAKYRSPPRYEGDNALDDAIYTIMPSSRIQTSQNEC